MFPTNVRFYPEGLENERYEEDMVWLVITKENWDRNIIFGESFFEFGVACLYAKINPNTDFIITAM